MATECYNSGDGSNESSADQLPSTSDVHAARERIHWRQHESFPHMWLSLPLLLSSTRPNRYHQDLGHCTGHQHQPHRRTYDHPDHLAHSHHHCRLIIVKIMVAIVHHQREHHQDASCFQPFQQNAASCIMTITTLKS